MGNLNGISELKDYQVNIVVVLLGACSCTRVPVMACLGSYAYDNIREPEG